MIPCPSCQQSVEILDKHMGTLFTCPHCNAVYFIDWNGQPELAQHEPESLSPASSYEEAAYNNFEPESGGEVFTNEEVPINEDENSPQGYETPSSYTEPVEGVAPADGSYDFSQTLDVVPETPFVSTADTSDFSDVTDFANSNTSAGPFSYTVRIEGVDSSRLLADLKEAMADSRFGWDVESILSNVGGGHIVLSGLTPAKASVLINRIKYLPVKISWRQDVFSGS